MGEGKEQLQYGKLRKLHHFTLMQPLKPENTYDITISNIQDDI